MLGPTASHYIVSAADSISIRLRLWVIVAVDGLATSKMKARVGAAGVPSTRAVIYIGQLAWPWRVLVVDRTQLSV